MNTLEHELRIELMAGCGLERSAAMYRAARLIAIYEKCVPSDHLQAILSERRHAVNEITPTSTLEERAEPRKCHCGEPFQPGQTYAVDGPEHIGCRRQSPRG